MWRGRAIMKFEIIDPIEYPGWDELLLNEGNHSIFHTAAWAKALRESYGYKAVYFSSFEDKRLSFLMPFMEVKSRLTGKRGVSLPFTDACYPFERAEGHLGDSIKAVVEFGRSAEWAYAEWRGPDISEDHAFSNDRYLVHDLDLTKSETEIFSKLKDSNQRNIRKASRDGLTIEIGTSPDTLPRFYDLNCLTRKHHGLPPQPLSFFKNVQRYIISRGYGTYISARNEGRIIASSIFLHFGSAAFFKYGASDPRHLNHRPNNAILWEAIRWYKARGMTSLSLGRTDIDDLGLLRFKRSWNGTEQLLRYYRFDFGKRAGIHRPFISEHGTKLFSYTPRIVLRMIGKALYRHMG